MEQKATEGTSAYRKQPEEMRMDTVQARAYLERLITEISAKPVQQRTPEEKRTLKRAEKVRLRMGAPLNPERGAGRYLPRVRYDAEMIEMIDFLMDSFGIEKTRAGEARFFKQLVASFFHIQKGREDAALEVARGTQESQGTAEGVGTPANEVQGLAGTSSGDPGDRS